MVTEVQEEGFFSRIISSIKGMLIGLVFFCGSFFLLFWNEGRSVKMARALDEGEGQTVHVEADSVDPGNDKKLIHVNGLATSDEVLSDAMFAVQEQAISLSRRVEMYQWEERKETKKKKKLGGGTKRVTTYEYEQQWSSSLINSDSFKEKEGHANPKQIPIDSNSQTASKVTLGAFTLPGDLVGQIGGSTSIALTEENIPEKFKEQMQVSGNELYLGQNPGSPQIGDVRVTFSVKKPCDISVCSQQTGETFQPFVTSNENELHMLEMGTLSIEEMYKAARDRNSFLTWILRAGGAILMFAGLMFLMAPLAVLGDVVPFVGSLISGGSAIIAGLLTIVFASGTIGFAWVFYRPLIGIPLLVLAGAVIVYMFLRRSNPETAQQSGFAMDSGPATLGEDDVVR